MGSCPHCPPLHFQALLNLARHPKSIGRYSEQTGQSTRVSNKEKAERKVQKALGQFREALENAKLHIEKLDFHLGILLEFKAIFNFLPSRKCDEK